MGSISSVNPGVADLIQTLTSVSSPVMSSPTVVSALESAPTADIVQLSSSANQLEGIDAMFGISTSATSNLSSDLLADLDASATGSSTASASVLSNASPADQAANADAALQSQLTQGLFGTNTSLTGSLFSTIG